VSFEWDLNKANANLNKRGIRDMRDEYDFSKGKRGPVISPDPNKIRITIRLDADIIDHFKSQVQEAGGGNYQTMINNALREYLNTQQGPLDEDTLRRVIREELQTPQ
jgi:uncharacterized protein (DUF4415 family)